MKIRIIAFFILISLFIFSGCNSTEDTAEYTLTVTLGEGVTGAPAAGTYTHAENDSVAYTYSAQAGYGNLTTTLDSAPIAASGTITVTGNHALNVTADIDLRGSWTGRFYHTVYDNYMEVTFSGDIFSGTAQWSIDAYGNGNGNFTIDDDLIEFTIQLSGQGVSFSGNINDINHMSGTWEFNNSAGLSTSSLKKLPSNGTWELDRN